MTVKAKYTLSIAWVIVLGLTACKKTPVNTAKKSLVNTTSIPFDVNSTPVDPGILGKWAILTDSTFTGVGLGNHPVNYAGEAGDYFDFRNDSLVYTKEGSALATLHYKFISDTSMIIGGFGIILNGKAETTKIRFTANDFFLHAPTVITPGGVFGRKVHLSR